MGNSVTCQITLDHEQDDPDAAIVAGNSLTGKVLVVVHEDIEPTDLFLHVAGTEQSTIQKGIKIFTALRFVFATHVALIERSSEDDGAKIERGSYGFPFEINLPSSLPSSTFAKTTKRGSPSNCKLEYKFYVMDKLQPTEDDFPSVAERLFVVSASPLPHNETVPIVIPPTNVTLKGVGGVLNRGSLSLGARIANSRIGRGEKLVISLACRNINATADISRIHIKLAEHISWSIEKNSNNKSQFRICGRQRARSVSPTLGPSDDELNDETDVAPPTDDGMINSEEQSGDNNSDDGNAGRATSHELERVLVELPDVTFPGFVKARSNQSAPTHPQVMVDRSHAEMYEDLKSKKNAVSLIVPNDARDTYVGHLLAVSHSVQITVHMDSKYCKDLPSVLTIPLKIGSPPEIQEAKAIAINYGDFKGMDKPPSEQVLQFPTSVEVVPDNELEQQLQAPQPPQARSLQRQRKPTANGVPAATLHHNHSYSSDDEDDSIGAERPALLRAAASMGKRVSASAPFGAQLPGQWCTSISIPDLEMENFEMRPPSFSSKESSKVGGEPEMVLEMDNDYYNQDSEHLNASFLMRPSMTAADPPVPVGLLRGFSSQVAASKQIASSSNTTGEAPLHSSKVNFDGFLAELSLSVDDYDFLEQKLCDASWRKVFAQLSSTEFGFLVANVKNDNDQPRVAALVASAVDQRDDGGGFTCEYVVAALQNAVDWTRCEVVNRLLPFCTDLLMAFHTIQDQLNDWEQVITANDFEEAIGIRSGSASNFPVSDLPT